MFRLQPSNATISTKDEMDFDKKRIVEVNADIRNASDFNVDISVRGFSSGIDFRRIQFGFLGGSRTFIKPRSFAIMCVTDRNRGMRKKRTFEFGKRRDGDFLVRFERHRVGGTILLPSHTFDFTDVHINITYVQLTMTVSCLR